MVNSGWGPYPLGGRGYPPGLYRKWSTFRVPIRSTFRLPKTKAELLICDEWGYVPLDRDGSKLLFQVISERYEQRSVIITTNLEFSKWVNIFYDEQLTAALIDRLVHHSYLLIFDGQSYRIKNSLMKNYT